MSGRKYQFSYLLIIGSNRDHTPERITVEVAVLLEVTDVVPDGFRIITVNTCEEKPVAVVLVACFESVLCALVDATFILSVPILS
ncbi:hypothetical protein C483_02176 [Natrialba hulunbeirensis JCM 10989]|uniref:Uncharacterized protein n=1 Tax=Natrialba hulunbeirensis JCM 10989 TaxID=1227493 RepID=M0ACQ6_9EURY|nr:hypothetical protein C483_02176 [Natrialba hulunbeirensis JCM 10989]